MKVKRFSRLLLIPVALLLFMALASLPLAHSAHADTVDPDPDPNPLGTPANLMVSNEEVLVWDGVTNPLNPNANFQSYTCMATGSPSVFAWTFIGPNATLVNRNRSTEEVYHGPLTRGPNPTPYWITTDSGVTGTVIARASGQAGAIPMLLLQAAPYGTNVPGTTLGNVNFIQRLDTSGGVAPSDPCTADNSGQFERVPYSAHYYFYAPEEDDGD